MKCSIVIPCYNTKDIINEMVELTIEYLKNLEFNEVEFVLVNDCSPDKGKTISILTALSEKYSFVKVLDLATNSGQHNAILAGLEFATGDYIVGMDDDMQTHPSQLPVLFEKIKDGFDIVYGYYKKKKCSPFRSLMSLLNFHSVRFLIGKPKSLQTSSYWIIKKYVRDTLVKYNYSHPYLQGMFLKTTNNIGCVEIQHFQRIEGISNYSMKSLIKIWSGILAFSVVPLRMAFVVGNVFSLMGILGAITIVVMKIIDPDLAVGWASTMSAICYFGGVNLFFIGLVGEYISRICWSVNKNPKYVIRDKINVEDKNE